MAFVITDGKTLFTNRSGDTRIWDFRIDVEEFALQLNVTEGVCNKWRPVQVETVLELEILEKTIGSK